MRNFSSPLKSFASIGMISAGLIMSGGSGVHAFDPEKVFKPNDEPRTILRYGYRALKDGKTEEAISTFRFGAVQRKHLPSQWKLARMFQLGDQVPQDHAAAFELYSQIADRFVEATPTRNDMPYVASAVVAVGHYHLAGLPEINLPANARNAERHFYRAAALYHDAEAQYRLARLYLGDSVGGVQLRTAVRWMRLSSKKGHPFAQAELGRMMFYGEGIRRDRVSGLVLLTRAALGTRNHPQHGNVAALQRQAVEDANRINIARANRVLRKQKISEVGVALFAAPESDVSSSTPSSDR